MRAAAPRPAPLGYPGPSAWLGLTVEPPVHREWIAARARAQFDAGLIDEAVALRARWDPTLPAFSAIGYAEAWSVVDGQRTLEEAIAADAARNVAFAKRQRTWFRSEPDISWLDATTGDPTRWWPPPVAWRWRRPVASPASRAACAGTAASSAPWTGWRRRRRCARRRPA